MKLYVGNLPHSYKDQDLEKIFSEYSSVTSCKLIFDRDTGRSKGFGFVEFGSNDEAQKAISELNGKDAGGRALVVNEARPQAPRENRDSRDSRDSRPPREGNRPYNPNRSR